MDGSANKVAKYRPLNADKLMKTTALSSGNHMASITRVLKEYFNITHYCYIKSFPDGTHLLLSNDSAWIERFYLDYYEHGAFHKVNDVYHSGYVLWNTIQDQATFAACREFFNIDHGITLIEKQGESCEFFCFGTKRENSQMIDFYINHPDLLKRFNAFFKEKAKTLIEKANADRLILPRCPIATQEIVSGLVTTDFDTLQRGFMEATECKRYYLSGTQSQVYLTPRQLSCLNLITLGKSVKEIAKTLGLSPRTVETYLNVIKEKMGAKNKTELIVKSLQHNHHYQSVLLSDKKTED